MPRPAPPMPPAAFPATPKPFVLPAEKEWSRHDSNHAPDIPRRTAHNPGDRPMTPCLLLTLTSPPAPAAASVRDAGKAASTRRGWAEPGQDRSGLWLRNAAAGLCVLAAAAAAVSFTAQYRMVDATRHLPGDRRAGGRDPRCRRAGLRLPRHRAGPARPPRAPRPGAEPGLGRRQRVHERDRRRTRAGGTWPSGRCPPSPTPWRATP